MKACPNTSLPEWNQLVEAVGEIEAYRDFYESGTIRSVDLVEIKISSRNLEESNALGPATFLQNEVKSYNTYTADAMMSNLLNRLSANTGRAYSILTVDEATQLLEQQGQTYDGQKGFYHAGTAYLVKGRFNEETAFHEFSHPIVDAIAEENPELFESLYDQAVAVSNSVELVELMYAENDSMTRKKEIIVRALTESVDLDTNESFVKKVMYAIKQFFRKLFGRGVKVSAISADTTLAEMAELIKTENFDYTFVQDPSNSVIQFLKDEVAYREALAKQDANEINAKINELKNIARISKRIVDENPEVQAAIKTENSRNLVEQLLADLGKAEKITPDMTAKETIEEVLIVNLNVLYQGIRDAQRIVANLESFSIDTNKDLNKEDLGRVMAVSKIAESLSIWAEHMNDLASENGVTSDNEFLKDLNEIINKATQVSNNVYTSLLELSTDFVYGNLSKGLIKDGEASWNFQMERAKTNNNTRAIENLERDKFKYFITREDIKKRLQNKLGDAPLISNIEAYVRSADPVVQSFAKWHLMNVSRVENESQSYVNDMINELYDDAVKVGYKPGSESEFFEALVFLDKSFRPKEVNPNSDSTKDKMSVEEHQVHTFLNPHKDYKWFWKQLNEELSIAVQDNNKEEYQRLMAKRALYMKFMHTAKTREHRQADEIFETAEYGEQAYAAKEAAIAKIKYADAKISVLDNGVDETDLFAEKEQALKDYQNLFRLTNLDGTKKSKEDQEIAKVLKEHRSLVSEFYTYEEIPGLFEMEYERYIDSLYEQGLDPQSKKFKNLRLKWIEDNTEIALRDEYREEEAAAYERLKEISKLLASTSMSRMDKLYEEMQDLTAGFRDNNLQIEAADLDPKVQARIKAIEEEIETLRKQEMQSNNLTKAQNEFISEVYRKIEEGTATDEEKAEVRKIYKNRVSTEDVRSLLAERNALLQFIRGLKNKLFTEYYFEVWQEHLDRIKEEGESNPAFALYKEGGYLAESKPGTQVNSDDITEMNNDTTIINTLLQDKLFAKWWNNNHRTISKTKYDDASGGYVKVSTNQPTSIWTVKVPKDKYLVSTKLSGETYYRTPRTVKYKSRVLANPIEKVAGETVSVSREDDWLPDLSIKEVTAKDGTVIRNPFINDAYFELKRTNPAKFRFLEKLKKWHLASQERVSAAGKLGYEVPRFERDAYDKVQNLANSGLITSFKENVKDIRQSVSGNARQKFEQGLNYEARLLINEGLVGDDLNKIPLYGISKLDNELVSLNLFKSLARYGTSTIMHRMLIDTSATAQMMIKVLSDPKSSLESETQIKRNIATSFKNQAAVTLSSGKGSNSIRESLIRSLYERDWLGQRYANTLADRAAPETMETVKKVGTAMSKVAANSYFAFNLSSAVKNRFSAIIQNNIEAAAGQFLNYRSLRKGKAIASKATVELSASIYKRGPKSKHIQIIQAFNIDGQLDKTADPMYRTLGRDAASGSWALSARKLLEMNASLELLFAMMDFQKVTLKDGTQISLYDAVELQDGKLAIREDVEESWSLDSDNFNDFKIKFQGVFDRLQGNYKDINQPAADRYFLFKQAAFMRKFFISMFMRRFARERPQSDLNVYEEGYYISALNYARDLIMYYAMGNKSATGNAIMKPNAKEAAALKRLGIDVASQLVMGLLAKYMLLFLFDYDEDDPLKKSKSKLRRATGPLPFIGVADDNRAFDPMSFMELHIINQLIQTNIEASSFNPHSFNKYGNLFLTGQSIYKQPFSSYGASIQQVYNIGNLTYDYLAGNSTGFYTRRVGPAEWQQKHAPKVLNTAFKTIGLGGVYKDLDAAVRVESTLAVPAMIKR